MSLHDFRRIALAYDLLVWEADRLPIPAQRDAPDGKAAEPARERIPAETAAQESDG